MAAPNAVTVEDVIAFLRQELEDARTDFAETHSEYHRGFIRATEKAIQAVASIGKTAETI